MLYRCLLLLSLCFFGLQCTDQDVVNVPDEVMGLAPVYEDDNTSEITTLAPQSIGQLGKIYYKDSIIFVGEINRGIHIIDNRNPAEPEPIAFLQITGNTDISIKGNILYANNVQDLVAIDISDINDVRVLSRLPNVFPPPTTAPPEDYVGYFECVDPELGAVAYWEERMLQSPECWR